MKMTLLEIVQTILSSLTSDEVNSITDTTESLQVANIVKDTYLSIVARLNLPETKTIIQLDSSGNVSEPVLMTLPNDIENLEYLKYNKILTDGIDAWGDIIYLPLDEFLRLMHMKVVVTDGTVGTFNYVMNGMTIKVYYENDKNPDYFTTLDDNVLLFDSYYSANDTTLQTSKTLGFGTYTYAFTLSDTFTPKLDSNQFALLVNEAKVQAFYDLKEQQNAIAIKRAQTHLIHGQKIKSDMPMHSYGSPFDGLPDYGRKGSTTGLSKTVLRTGK